MLLALLLALAILLLAGCSNLTGGSETDWQKLSKVAACGVFGPITYSKQDTDATRRQIREHDAAGAAVCGWKPK